MTAGAAPGWPAGTVLLAVAAALMGARDGGAAARSRSRALAPARPEPRRPHRPRAARGAAAAGGGVAVALLLGGATGAVVGLVAGGALGWLLRRLPDGADAARRAAARDGLPLVLDLVAAGLSAGAPLVQAVEIVAAVSGGPLATDLGALAQALRLGASPAEAAAPLAAAGPPFVAVVRAVSRADDSGSRLAVQLTTIADGERVAAHGRDLEAARRVGVIAVAPLGLCFLPAFVLIGVVPVIAGAARDLVL